ncbi:MAG TPA: hypothetical protein VGQ81_01295 [Acidobacteriota bacterium]|nr:hypothetical protein [Acidobacteriota bacterium]
MKRIIWVLLLLFLSITAHASEPRTWSLSTQQEFLKGKLRGVSLTSDGRIILAPSLEEKGNASQAYVFSMVQNKGGDVFLGTGNEGKIFRLSSNGKSSELVTLKEIAIYALATDNDGRLYAGSSPDGKVYEISSSGQAKEIFDPKEKYIWSLTVDRHGNLFVGTGPRGIIFKVNPKGEGSQFYDSPETHITALAMDGEDLLAGSSPNAYIYRIDPKGKPFVIYDSSLSEIKSLAVDRAGLVYATAIGSSESPHGEAEEPKTHGGPVRIVARARPAGSHETELSTPSTGPTHAEERKSEAYRISKDSIVETILSSDEDLFYSLLVRNDGTVLVGSGKRGRIFLVDRNRAVTILLQVPEEQVTGLLERDSRILASTSNLGKVFEINAATAASGWYESEILDAKIPSKWGMIRWYVENAAGAGIEFYSRSGNTKAPDKSWSDWQGPYKNSSGEHIKSPVARFFQMKLQLSGGSRMPTAGSTATAVRSLAVSYMQQNVPPQIVSITVHPPGVAFQQFPAVSAVGAAVVNHSQSRASAPTPRSARDLEPQSVRPLPRRVFQAGAQSISWEAHDENGDELEYALYFKGEGESNWKLLEDHLSDTTYTIDSKTLPDGIYSVKVVATDAPANPHELALTDEMLSKTFVINNSPPRVIIKSNHSQGNSVEVRFEAQSESTPLYQAEYSVDGSEWQIIYPVDGITDGLKEEYVFTVRASPGEHSVGIRVTDGVGNVGTGKVIIKM